jgi:16S rRNA (adenine1518-N6/adenine1519-N6)-dimethyltransferase
MTLDELKKILRDFQLTPNKTMGQNFLMNDEVLAQTVAAADIKPDDVVIEVGPGIATLTKLLAQKAGRVIAVEKDEHFLPLLKKLAKSNKNVEVVMDDILKTDIQTLVGDQSYKVVANIPYYLTGKLIPLFLEHVARPKSLTLLIQKEVGENIVARPGSMSLASVATQLYAAPKIIAHVPPSDFFPAPKVESVVLHLDVYKKSPYAIRDNKLFFKVLKACFLGKRKQLHNTLTNNLKLEKDVVMKILSAVQLSPEVRPQELSIDDWVRLVDEVAKV